MTMKTMMFVAVSASALALLATDASAQATPTYNSPAQARTYDDAPASPANWNRRAAVQHRHMDAYAAAPAASWQQQPNVTNKHTVYIQDY